MSRIYFHTPSDTAEILGPERHHAGSLANEIGLAPLHPLDDLYEVVDAPYKPRDAEGMRILLRVEERAFFRIGGERVSVWETLLNTTLALGNDPVCFLARMHAQCEIHAWVAGVDRAWLAGVIEQGLKIGVMREGMGWPKLCEFLRANEAEPVVMSYSVTDGFPSRSVADWRPEPDDEDGDRWYDVPHEERWRLAFAGIEKMRFDAQSLRSPFGHCKTAFDILAERARRRAAARP